MIRYVLSKAAVRDLDQIWDYTSETWSIDQAERYIVDIENACENLANGERAGQRVDDIREGYRKLAVGSHFLFYRFKTEDVIEVVRILHQSMDLPSHL